MASGSRDEFVRERIESWKGIAAHFRRDERTVKRWEQERGLPVHRIPGLRGRVFAYADELNAWVNSGVERETGAAAEVEEAIPEDAQGVGPTLAVVAAGGENREWRWHWPGWPGLRTMLAAVAFMVAALSVVRLERVRKAPANTSEAAEPDATAREFYLQGRYYWNRRTADSLNQAVDAYTQAIVHDSNYAAAYAGLAETYDLLPQFTPVKMTEALPRAIVAARKAIALNERLPEAHRALGWALFLGRWDVKGAEAEYRRAIELDPQNAEGHHWFANLLLTLGRQAEARTEIDEARRIDPASRAIQMDLALIVYEGGERQGGIERMLAVEKNEPDYLAPPRYLTGVLIEQGSFGEYIVQAKLAATISRDADAMAVAEAAEHGWEGGGRRGMLEEMEVVQKQQFDRGAASGFQLAETCVWLGKREEADRYLEAALERNDARVMTIFSGLFTEKMKDDAGFQKVEKEVETRAGYGFGEKVQGSSE